MRRAAMNDLEALYKSHAESGDASVDMGVMNPSDYCQSQPNMVIPSFLNGNQASAQRAGIAASARPITG